MTRGFRINRFCRVSLKEYPDPGGSYSSGNTVVGGYCLDTSTRTVFKTLFFEAVIPKKHIQSLG